MIPRRPALASGAAIAAASAAAAVALTAPPSVQGWGSWCVATFLLWLVCFLFGSLAAAIVYFLCWQRPKAQGPAGPAVRSTAAAAVEGRRRAQFSSDTWSALTRTPRRQPPNYLDPDLPEQGKGDPFRMAIPEAALWLEIEAKYMLTAPEPTPRNGDPQ